MPKSEWRRLARKIFTQRPARKSSLQVNQLEDRVTPATWYVSTTGLDSADGITTTTPVRTIQHAVDLASASNDGNDYIYVQGGTYNTVGTDERFDINNSTNLNDLVLSGGWNSNFTTQDLINTPTDYTFTNTASPNRYDIQVLSPSTTISGFTFRSSDGTTPREADTILVGTNNVTIDSNVFNIGIRNGGTRPAGVVTSANTNAVSNLTVSNNSFNANYSSTPSSSTYGIGVFLNTNTSNNLKIQNNKFQGNNFAAMVSINEQDNVLIDGNTFTRTGPSGFQTIDLRGPGSTPLNNITITNNSIDGANVGAGIGIGSTNTTGSISGITVTGNTIQNTTAAIIYGPGANQKFGITATVANNTLTGNSINQFTSSLDTGGSTTINGVSIDPGSNTITASSSAPQDFKLALNGSSVEVYDVTVPANPNLVFSTSNNSTPVVINGVASQNNTLSIDYSGGVPTNPITFNGGTGGNDTLAVVNAPSGNAQFNYTNANDGSVVVPGGSTINYTGLDPITYTSLGGTLTFNLTAGNDDIAVSVDGSNNIILTGSTIETTTVSLAGITGVVFNSGGGSDKLTFNSVLTQNVTANVADVVLNANIGGTVTGTAATVLVNSGASIQDGIDIAANSATVNVAAGTYSGGILIDRTLTITGSGSPTVSSMDLNGQDVGFQYAANGGTLQGFNIISDGVGTEYGVLLSDKNSGPGYSGATVQNNSFSNLEYGIATADGAFDYSNAILQNNTITIGTGTWGIYLTAGGGGHQLYGNTISGGGATAAILVQSIDNVTIGGTGVGQGNTITGTIGALLAADTNNVSFIGNTVSGVTGSDRGSIRVEGNVNGLTVSQNSITGGIVPAVRVRQNFSMVPNSNIVVNNNFLTNNSYAIQVDTDGLSNDLDARFNDMSGNSTGSILNSDTNFAVNASNNYFGSNDLATVSAGISGDVDYTPYLNLGTDTDSGTYGFQGDFSDLTVHPSGSQTAGGRITEGYSSLTSTGTLHVLAGSYTDNADMTVPTDKAVTLAAGASPAQVTVNGNFTLSNNDTLPIEFVGTVDPTTDYDNFIVNGTVTLGNATLTTPFLGTPNSFTPTQNQVFTIIANDGTDTVTGTFNGAPAGTVFTVDTKNLKIFYNGGDGNDVVLVDTSGVPSTLYVNDEFTTPSYVDGDAELAGVQGAYVGVTAFASISDALTLYPTFSGTIIVNGGTYTTGNLTGGGAVTLQLVQDLVNNELDVTIQNLSGDVTDAVVTRLHNAANANLIAEQGSFAGVISGSGNLVKQGTGTLTLSGANTYSGTTTISAGTLALGNNSALGDEVGKTVIASGATLDIKGFRAGATGNELVEVQGTGVGGNGAIVNTGAFQTSAFRRLTLTGNTLIVAANRFDVRNNGGTATLDMNGFTLTKSGAAEVSIVSATIADPGSVNVNQGIFRVEGTTVFGGTGTISVATGATLDFWGNAQTHSVNITLAAGSNLTTSPAPVPPALPGAGPTLSGAIALTSGNVNFGISRDTTVSGIISGSGSLVKQGAGTLTLSGTGSTKNLASGLLQVDAGTVNLGAGFAGDGAWNGDVTINSGGTVKLLQGHVIVNSSDVTINSGGTFNMNSQGEAVGNLSGGGNITNNGGLYLDDLAAGKTFAGNITGLGGLFLRGGVSTGSQTLNGGTSSFGSIDIGLTGAMNTLNIAGATTSVTSTGNLYLGGQLISPSSAGTLNLSGGTLNVAGQVRLGHYPSETSYFNLSGGAFSAGELHVGWNGNGMYNQTGGTATINNRLNISRASNLSIGGSGATTLTVNGGGIHVAVTGSGGSMTVLPNAAVNTTDFYIGEGGSNSGSVTQSGGVVTVSNQMRVAHYPNETSTYTLSGGDLNLTGNAVSNPFTGGNFEQPGVLYLGIDGTGVFNQSGGTVTAQGMVLDNRWDAAAIDTYTMTGGLLTLGKWGIQGNPSTLVNLEKGTVAASADWNSSRPITLTSNTNPVTFDTNGFNIGLTQPLSGAGGLVKEDGGTLTLTGTNTYTGTTTVNAGTLLVNGSNTGTGAVNVNGTSILGGSGSITGPVNINGSAHLAPGNSPDTLGSGTVTFVSGSNFDVEIGSTTPGNGVTGYDQLIVTGGVNLGGATLNLFQLNSFTVNNGVLQTFTIIDNDGTSDAVSGTFNGLPEGSKVSYAGGYAYISYAGGDGNDVVLSSQPLVIGTPGPDTVVLTPTATGYDYTVNSNPTVSVVGNNNPFNFFGNAGDDLLVVNTNANSIPQILYVGGTQDSPLSAGNNSVHGDVLTVNDNGSNTITYLADGVVSANDNDGTVTVAGQNTITFQQLEPVDIIGAATVNVNFPNADDIVNLTNGLDAGTNTNDAIVVSGTSGGVPFESVHLRNNANVVINTVTGGSDGNDTVTVNSADNGHGNTNLTINTGALSGNDSVTFLGNAAFGGTATITSKGIAFNGGTLSTTGNTTLTAGAGGISTNGPAQDINAATLTVTNSAGDIGSTANRLKIDATTLKFTANGKNVYIEDTASGLQVDSSTVGAANTIDLLVTGGNLTSKVDNNRDLGAQTLILSVPNGSIGAGAGNWLELNVLGTITATTGPGNGNISLRQVSAGNLSVANVDAGTGDVDIHVSNGNLLSAAGDSGTADIVGTNVTLRLGATGHKFGNNAGDRLEIDATKLQLFTTLNNNNAYIVDTTGGLQVTNSTVGGGGTFDLKAVSGSITGDNPVDGTGDVRADTVILEVTGSGSTIGTGTPLEINANTVLHATTAGGNIFVSDVALDLPVGVVNANGGDVYLKSVGAITDTNGNGVTNIIGANLAAGAGSGINLDTDVDSVTLGTGFLNITIREANDLTINGAVTTFGSIAIDAQGNMTVSGPVATISGAVTLRFGLDDTGHTANVNATIDGSSATVQGDFGDDTINVTVTGSTNLTVDGKASSDTYNIAFGSLGTGDVVIADSGTGNTDQAFLTGTIGADLFNVNNSISGANAVHRNGSNNERVSYNSSLEEMQIDAGVGDDTYDIWFANTMLPGKFVIVGNSGNDTASISGTDNADNPLDVGYTKTDRVTLGTENVDFDGTLETLVVNAKDGSDMIFVKPDAETAITIHGGNPVSPVLPGDILILDVSGTTVGTISNPAIPNGSITFTSGEKTINWTSIESLPVPLGLGGSFDFGSATSPVQGSTASQVWLPVSNTKLYGSGPYGWATAVNSFDRAPNTFRGIQTGGAFDPSAKLYEDGAWNYSPSKNSFYVAVAPSSSVWVTVFLGDNYDRYYGLNVYADGTKYVSNQFIPVGELQAFRFLATDDGDGKLDLAIEQPLYSTYWVWNGVDVRPAGFVAPITIHRDTPTGIVAPSTAADKLVANGLTVDSYFFEGVQPNTYVTVATSNGTITSADADAYLAGIQILADGNGKGSFTIQRPTGITTADISVRSAYNDAASDALSAPGNFQQQFELAPPSKEPITRFLDFGSASSPVQAGFVGVPNTQVYTGQNGNALGWMTSDIQSFDRGAAAGDLLRDGAWVYPSDARDFQIDVADGTYYVTVLMGDPNIARDKMNAEPAPGFGTVMGQANPLQGPTNINTNVGEAASVTYTVNVAGGTGLRLRFSDSGGSDGYWVAQGLYLRAARDTISITPGASVPSDGSSLANFAVSGGVPNSLVTVASTLGMVTTTDASSAYAGIQILLNGSGDGSFSVQAPYSPSGLTGKVAAIDVTGAAVGDGTSTFTAPSGPSGLKFDFNSSSNVTESGYTGVRGSDIYTDAKGYGWKAAVNEYDRGSPNSLDQDGAWGYGGANADTFLVKVDAGSSVNATYHLGDQQYARNVYLSIEGLVGETKVTTAAGEFKSQTLSGLDANNDGIVEIHIRGGYSDYWTLAGLEVAKVSPLLAEAPDTTPSNVSVLTQDQLDGIVVEAINRWAAAGVKPEQVAAMRNVSFSISDLNSTGRLGQHAAGTIVIDDDGIGQGWFVDSTPSEDSEFVTRPGPGGYDLLTVVMHELGHELGLVDRNPDLSGQQVMDESLPAGVRRVPTALDAEAIAALTVQPAYVGGDVSSPLTAETIIGAAMTVTTTEVGTALAGGEDDAEDLVELVPADEVSLGGVSIAPPTELEGDAIVLMGGVSDSATDPSSELDPLLGTEVG